jgi:ABC-2 type transport system ATP-binding protein
MANPLAISTHDVQKRYGHIKALKGLSLDIEAGQIFGLIGANGAGKTTFIKLLVGISRPDAGSLQLLGLDPLHAQAELRQRIGYMPQSPALYDDLTAAENVTFFGRAHRLTNLRRQVEEALDFVELSQRADDPVGNLSGGMRQRVSLACALVHQPSLLLLDEPTAGIDLKLRASFWKHFNKLAAGGATILVSTHQMDEAAHCDKLAIISQGRLVAHDTPQALMHQGRATVRIWQGGTAREQRFENYPRELPEYLHAQGLSKQIERLEIEPSPLEDIVLNLLGDIDNTEEVQS